MSASPFLRKTIMLFNRMILMTHEPLPKANTMLKVIFCLSLRARFQTIGIGSARISRSPSLFVRHENYSVDGNH